MGVPLESVQVGKYFLTELGQLRRVLAIRDGMVTYELRGKHGYTGSAELIRRVATGHFANRVDREVAANYKPRV